MVNYKTRLLEDLINELAGKAAECKIEMGFVDGGEVLCFRVLGVEWIDDNESKNVLELKQVNFKRKDDGEELYGTDAYYDKTISWMSEIRIHRHRNLELSIQYHDRPVTKDWVSSFLNRNKVWFLNLIELEPARKKAEAKRVAEVAKIAEAKARKRKEGLERGRRLSEEIKVRKLKEEALLIEDAKRKDKERKEEGAIISKKKEEGNYVPIMKVCPLCNGSGGIRGGCNRCYGKGFIETL